MRLPRCRRVRHGAWVVALALLLIACGGGKPAPVPGSSASETPRRGGTAVLGSISDVDSWNEYLSRQTFANNLHRKIYLHQSPPLLMRYLPAFGFLASDLHSRAVWICWMCFSIHSWAF